MQKKYFFRGTKPNFEQVSGIIERPKDDKKFAQELLKAFLGADKNGITLFTIEVVEMPGNASEAD